MYPVVLDRGRASPYGAQRLRGQTTAFAVVFVRVEPMTDGDSPPPSKGFDERLRALREKTDEQAGRGQSAALPRSAMGYAFRIGVELVAGLLVGGGIGWVLDYWLGTSPLLLILFFFLGSAAGILNVYRAAREMQRAETKDED